MNIIINFCPQLLTNTHTFNASDVDVELSEFLAGPLHALIHRLEDLFGVFFHPSDRRKTNKYIFVCESCTPDT